MAERGCEKVVGPGEYLLSPDRASQVIGSILSHDCATTVPLAPRNSIKQPTKELVFLER
jgi:hypothetical protein